MNLRELGLTNNRVGYKSLAEGIVCNAYGLRKESVRESFADFRSLEHRMEQLPTRDGIKFVNDSKATNVNSAWFALEETVGPIVWIAGGIDRGNSYDPLKDLVKKKVKAIVLLGVDTTLLEHAFNGALVMAHVTNMWDAVRVSYAMALPGDTILLSPACASFDLFVNYEDRGIKFKNEVFAL